MFYIPQVFCAKCQKPAIVRRQHNSQNNRRVIIATCHGQTAETSFVTKPNETVTLWENLQS